MSVAEVRPVDRVRVRRSETSDAVAVIELDTPGRSLNVIDESLMLQLAAALDEIEEAPGVRAVVLASAKAGSFGAGADLNWLPTLAAAPDADAFLARTHALMVRLATFGVPVVAALDGVALGGALEIALACESIVATDCARIGLPEASLGLLPGGGGTQLLLRWVPPATAVELLVSGRHLGPVEAKELGMVDSVVEQSALRATAVERALALAEADASRRDLPTVSAADQAAALAAGESVKRVASPVAKEAILAVMAVGLAEGLHAGLAEERRRFLDVLSSAESLALRHMFILESAGRRSAVSGAASGDASRLGLVGAGQMGAGIAATGVARGLEVVLRDVDADRLGDAKQRALREVARIGAAADVDAAWSGTTAWDGFESVDAVVEAVFELPSLKLEILSELSEAAPHDALIATNTSAIQIGSLSGAVAHPERFLGMHFFSPVERMPLVELVPHGGTAAEAIVRATALARRLGKVPVTVGDLPGFFTSRVYARWLLEGLRLLQDGFSVEQIDAEAKAAGFPTGPLQAHDEATLDLVLKASLTQVADKVMADRLNLTELRALLEGLIAGGVVGRRAGAGFYLYPDNRRVGVNPAVLRHVEPKDVSDRVGEAGERLLLAFVSESLLCWDDGTLCHPEDGDLASVLGIGFPRRLGGPFHWAQAQGLDSVRQRCLELGGAFPVAEALMGLIAAGGDYADLARRDRPGVA